MHRPPAGESGESGCLPAAGYTPRGYEGNADMTVMNELARMGGVAGTSLASLGHSCL